jgi:N6-L-threonylcarbamoyladenine synthase
VSNVVYSQIDIHKRFHGVVPELASRAHAEKIAAVMKSACGDIKPQCIAFANGPGLSGGLLVGRVAAQCAGEIFEAPVVGINHLEGHLYACEFDGPSNLIPLDFPLISLIVSGGHTELWLVRGYGKYKLLGKTRDDAAGEAFDKVAKLLGLPYPGGPQVSREAQKGVAGRVKFPRPYMTGTFEFSFSGLKTAVSYYLKEHKNFSVADICAEFENAVSETLVRKTVEAALKYKVKNIAVGGGVAANEKLRVLMEESASAHGMKARFVGRSLSSDNAAMIALCAARKMKYAKAGGDIKIKPDMILRSWK